MCSNPNISASTWPNIKSKDSFGKLRTSRFQNCPWFLELMKIWWSYWWITKVIVFCGHGVCLYYYYWYFVLFSTYSITIIIQVSSTSMAPSPSIEAGKIFHPSILVVSAHSSVSVLSSSDDVSVIILISKTTGITNK